MCAFRLDTVLAEEGTGRGRGGVPPARLATPLLTSPTAPASLERATTNATT